MLVGWDGNLVKLRAATLDGLSDEYGVLVDLIGSSYCYSVQVGWIGDGVSWRLPSSLLEFVVFLELDCKLKAIRICHHYGRLGLLGRLALETEL